MKKAIRMLLLVGMAIVGISIYSPKKVSAYEKLKTYKSELNSNEEKELYQFKYDEESKYYWFGTTVLTGEKQCKMDDIQIAIYETDEEEKLVVLFETGTNYTNYLVYGKNLNETLKLGHSYKVVAKNTSQNNYSITFYARKYNTIAKNYSLPKAIYLNTTDGIKTIPVKNITPIESLVFFNISKSSNNKIARVYADIEDNRSQVKYFAQGFKEGKCKFIFKDVIGKKHTINVIVKNPLPHLKHNTLTVSRNHKAKNKLLNAKGKVVWKSSNSKIATVSKKGVIKGRKKGKCIIKAKCKGKTYKCKVKIR